MWDDEIDRLANRRGDLGVAFDSLMPHRVRNILLVSSLYDSYTFVEDGRLTSMLFTEYYELNIRYAPRIDRVSTATKALELIESERYDLVISMLRIGDMNIREFGLRVREIDPGLPVVLLAFNTRELLAVEDQEITGIDRVFVWNGDAKLFLAMIKSIEDKFNAWHDARAIGVHSVLLIEDSIRFCSSYLPMLYTEILHQNQLLMSDGLNELQRITRQHARPKVLLATTWEEGLEIYEKYRDYLIGVIADAAFPRNGKLERAAGLEFARMVKEQQPDLAVLVQSSEDDNGPHAHELGAAFINKRSPRLLHDLRDFMKKELGFGDFVFRRSDGSVVTSARDLRGLAESLKFIPVDSFNHHVRRKDFSTWLIARTEFGLARSIRASSVTDFDSPTEYRNYLVGKLDAHRHRAKAGIVSEFSSGTFEAGSGFVRIGNGSLGGKGRGLAFFNSLLENYRISETIPGVNISVPPSAVLTTDVFEQFIDAADLSAVVLEEENEEAINEAILGARFAEDVTDKLRTFLSRVRYPLAVRSSSLMEDASSQPFSGIYKTFMLPNSHDQLDIRLKELLNAIKHVYASTYSRLAKSYLAATPNRLEEEQMAVVIQQLFGRRRGGYLYPDIAGVARSYNYYPFPGQKPEDGVVCGVLGLGRTVVEGGRCIRFSPKEPASVFDVLTPRDFLNYAQRRFYALDLNATGPDWSDNSHIEKNIVRLDLETAREHGSLGSFGSVYSPRDRSIHESLSTPGIPLVTMSKFLKDPQYKLNEVLAHLLDICQTALSCAVEIEFAANIREENKTVDLAFLQVRPMGQQPVNDTVSITPMPDKEALCQCDRALGNGRISNVRDIIYVPQDRFSRMHSGEIAEAIGNINERLGLHDRPFILIGPGRWGSADPRLGTPVTWAQISHVACIVEMDLLDFRVSPSQGSHFFQNITSFGIGYFTINDDDSASFIDKDWLESQPCHRESEFVRHIAFETPFTIAIDGRTGRGVITAPN